MIKKRTLYAIIIIAAIMALIFVAISFIVINGQNSTVTEINHRLAVLNIPVKNILIVRRIPFDIKIELQSQSTDTTLTIDDNWNMVLAEREATIAFRFRTRLKSFQLVVFNSKGEEISSSQRFLYPEDLSQKSGANSPKVDNATAKEIVRRDLQLSGLNLDLLDIMSNEALGESGQILVIEVSQKDVGTINKSLPTFLSSYFNLLENANTRYGTYFTLSHLRVVDGKGNVLLDYVDNLDGGPTRWKITNKDLYADWFPHPPFDTPTPSPTIKTQNPADGYPVGTSTATVPTYP